MKSYMNPEFACWDNDNDALVPELWAFEALATLGSNLVMGNLVHRDFEPVIASFGDVVNASRPADFKGKRKTDSDSITLQDAKSSNIPVPLDQHIHVSFVIKDGELSKAQPDLIQRYLEPAARELAEKVDQVLAGQAARLMANQVGGLAQISKTNATDYVLEADTILNVNKAPKRGRSLVLGPQAQKAALGAELFVSAEKRGDEGTALRDASLGRVYGFDSFMDQNVSDVKLGDSDYQAGVTDGAHDEGFNGVIDTTLTYSDVTVGDYVTIGGRPYRVTVVADDGGDANITLDEGLVSAVSAGDDVKHWLAATVDGAKAAGYAKEIDLDGYTANKHPQVGQQVSFGTGANSHHYTIIDVTENTTTSSSVLLDRPLSAALSDNDNAHVGPAGGYNLAFTRDAIALVTRPLALVPPSAGAQSFVANFEGVSMRVTMQYDINAQGMVVTFDLLCGVAILDDRQAVVLLS